MRTGSVVRPSSASSAASACGGFFDGLFVGRLGILGGEKRLGVRRLLVHGNAHVVDHVDDVFDLFRIDDLAGQVVVHLRIGEEALFLAERDQQLELRLPLFGHDRGAALDGAQGFGIARPPSGRPRLRPGLPAGLRVPAASGLDAFRAWRGQRQPCPWRARRQREQQPCPWQAGAAAFTGATATGFATGFFDRLHGAALLTLAAAAGFAAGLAGRLCGTL